MMKYFRTVALLGALVLVTVVAAMVFGEVPIVEKVKSVQRLIASMGPRGAALYPLFYAACNVLLLPAGVLSIGGGFFFGLWWGFLLVLIGNVTGAALAFGISRAIGRGWFERRMLRRPRWAALDAAIAREGWQIIVLSQVHPLFPTSLINYLYGITRIRFWTCMLWVAVGQAPGLFLYAYLGTLAQLGMRLIGGETHPRLIEYLTWGGGLVLTVVVTTALARIALRLMRETEAADAVLRTESARSAGSGNTDREKTRQRASTKL
jgi:uncharacterized membrane protein YdjX (TVP38/TMEM64 family)